MLVILFILVSILLIWSITDRQPSKQVSKSYNGRTFVSDFPEPAHPLTEELHAELTKQVKALIQANPRAKTIEFLSFKAQNGQMYYTPTIAEWFSDEEFSIWSKITGNSDMERGHLDEITKILEQKK